MLDKLIELQGEYVNFLQGECYLNKDFFSVLMGTHNAQNRAHSHLPWAEF